MPRFRATGSPRFSPCGDQPRAQPRMRLQRVLRGLERVVGRRVLDDDRLDFHVLGASDAGDCLADDAGVVVEREHHAHPRLRLGVRPERPFAVLRRLALEPPKLPLEPALPEQEALECAAREIEVARIVERALPLGLRILQPPGGRKRPAGAPRGLLPLRRNVLDRFGERRDRRRERKLLANEVVRRAPHFVEAGLVVEEAVEDERKGLRRDAEEVLAGYERVVAVRVLRQDDRAVRDRAEDSLPLEVGRFVAVDIEQDPRRAEVPPLPRAREERGIVSAPRQ